MAPVAAHLTLLLAPLLPSGSAIKVNFDRYPTAYPTLAPTPAPTLSNGVPCPCLQNSCFDSYDRDSNGCLDYVECDFQTELLQNCRLPTWDTDGDGCINETVEWPVIFAMTNGSVCPVATPDPPPVCGSGYYLSGMPVLCVECLSGETRRRRSLECTTCPIGKFDGGDFDDCIDSSSDYLPKDLPPGSDSILIMGGADIRVGDDITIRGPEVGADCVPSAIETCRRQQETVRVTAKSPNMAGYGFDITISPPTTENFPKFSGVVLACTSKDGTDLSRKYSGVNPPMCSCGDTECTNLELCLVPNNGTGGTGTCLPAGPYPYHETPAPTVGAKGDPHLVNLQGEHFDINHAGEFTLLRLPQAPEKPTEFQLRASIQPEAGRPCTTYITQVEFSGQWLGGKSLHLRSYLRSTSNKTYNSFLGAKLVEAGARESSWEPIEMVDDEQVLSEPHAEVEITLSKSQWFPKKRAVAGVPTVAGMFTLTVRKRKSPEGAKVIVRQDLSEQEHLNLAMRRLSTLGRLDVGGLLGFDFHPNSLEYVSAECNHHRATSQSRTESQEGHSGYYFRPTWKDRWDNIRRGRGRHNSDDENPNDNEAAATLIATRQAAAFGNAMCKCPFSADFGLGEEGVLVAEDDAHYLHALAEW